MTMRLSRMTRNTSLLTLILSSLCLTLLAASASAQQLKIATLAPDGSSWMEGLRTAAAEVEQRTGGAVTTRFYPGGVMGDAATLLRRIRLGQLHGGTFTLGELATIAPETNLFSLLFQFENADEVAAMREEFDPLILAALERNGMIAPAIANGGFAYLFSRQRIAAADEISTSFKVWIPENDPLSRRTLERLGASAISLGLAEVYTGLQTGTINTFGSTLAGAIILQWHTRARYVLDLPVLVTAGTLAVDRKAFERISPEHQLIWREEFGRALRQQEADSEAENVNARAALIGEDIEFIAPAPGDVVEWRRVANEVLDEMLESGTFELPGIDRLRERLEAIRGSTR